MFQSVKFYRIGSRKSTNLEKMKEAVFVPGALLTLGPSSSFHQTVLLSVHSQGYPELPGTGSDCVTHVIYVGAEKLCTSKRDANLNWWGGEGGSFIITTTGQ